MNGRFLFFPCALIYGGVASFRRWLYKKRILKPFTAAIPVISVGNLAVGGTGKTPHTLFIAEKLSKSYAVAILSRGYGRKSKGYLLANSYNLDEVNSEMLGDEPLLMFCRKPAIPLAVDGDRKEGILKLCLQYSDLDAIIMDDAMQHVSVQPSCQILLTEYHHPYSEDYPMPVGSLRELKGGAAVADMVIVTKVDVSPAEIDRRRWRMNLHLTDNQELYFTRYRYDSPLPVTEMARLTTFNENTKVVLLTGIAHPEPLVAHLYSNFTIVRHIVRPDHHFYSIRELKYLKNTYFNDNQNDVVLFTTEKDWMRLQTENVKNIVSLLPVFMIPIQVEFLFDEENILIKSIENYVRRKKQKN